MSVLSIAHYFPFRRIRIIDQCISVKAKMAQIDIVPDKRFHPICHQCRSPSLKIHSREERVIRDLKLTFCTSQVNFPLCWKVDFPFSWKTGIPFFESFRKPEIVYFCLPSSMHFCLPFPLELLT